MSVWTVVAGVGVGTILLKGLGPTLLGSRSVAPRVQALLALLAPALLAALVVTQTLGRESGIVADARLPGVAAAAVAIAVRAPLLVVVAAAAAAAALARAVG